MLATFCSEEYPILEHLEGYAKKDEGQKLSKLASKQERKKKTPTC